MAGVNSICFDTKYYDDPDDVWYDIKDVMNILAKNDYIMVVRPADCGLTFLDFEPQDRTLGDPYPFWLTPSEFERLVFDDEVDDVSGGDT